MSSRVAGAGFALIAAALLAGVIATPVLVPAEYSLFAGHPTVNSQTRRTQEVFVGLYDAQLCNTGGDLTCKSGAPSRPYRIVGFSVLGAMGIALLGTLALFVLALSNGQRRRGIAWVVRITCMLALGGMGGLVALEPFREASIPLNPIGAAAYGGAILMTLLASIVAARPSPQLKLRVSDRPTLPAIPPPQQVADLAAHANHEPHRGPDPYAGHASDPFAPQPGADQPLFSAAPQLRPLYDATPLQGGTGGLLGMERPLPSLSSPVPRGPSGEIPAAMPNGPTSGGMAGPFAMTYVPGHPSQAMTESFPLHHAMTEAFPLQQGASHAMTESFPPQHGPSHAMTESFPLQHGPSHAMTESFPLQRESSQAMAAAPSDPARKQPPPPPRGKASTAVPPAGPPVQTQVSSVPPMPLDGPSAFDLSASYDPPPSTVSGDDRATPGSGTDLNLYPGIEGSAPSPRERVETPLAPPPVASPPPPWAVETMFVPALEAVPVPGPGRFDPRAMPATQIAMPAQSPPAPPPAGPPSRPSPVPPTLTPAALTALLPPPLPRPPRENFSRLDRDPLAPRPPMRATVPMPARPSPSPTAPARLPVTPARPPMGRPPMPPATIPPIRPIPIPAIPAIPTSAGRAELDLDDADDRGNAKATISDEIGEITNVSVDLPLPDASPGDAPPSTSPPRRKLSMSTAPDSLPPPMPTTEEAIGPAPACPQCESPMGWVEEHLRFYCRSCRMYF